MGVIAFDIDGCLANFIRGFTRIGNKLFGTPVGDTPSQQQWMFESMPELGLDKAKCTQIWDVVKASKGFWANLDPYNASLMFNIDRIVNKIFITNRMGVLPKEQSIAFLERWGVIDPQVFIASEKGPVALAEHVVAAVDDYYPNCQSIHAAVPTCYMALLIVPYTHQYRDDWQAAGGEEVLSMDHFVCECDKRGIIEWSKES